MSYPSRSFPTKRNKNIWNFEYTVTGNRILLRVMNFRNKLVPEKRGSTVYRRFKEAIENIFVLRLITELFILHVNTIIDAFQFKSNDIIKC